MSEEAADMLNFYLYESETAKEFWDDIESAAAKYEVTVDYYMAEFV